MLAAQVEQEQREFREQAQREVVKQLATSQGNPEVIARKVEAMVRKRAAARRQQLEAELSMPPPQFKGLVKPGSHKPQAPMTPFTPFNGDRQKSYVFEVKDDYADPFLDDIKNQKDYLAGGFSVKGAYRQALVQAFFGLRCDVQKEKAVASAS
jgi:CDK-activating kinase assembly factor MAT1